MSTTVISCYYKFPSKHSYEKYDSWIKNFFSYFKGNLVLFTSPDLVYYFTSIQSEANIYIISKTLEELPIVQKYAHIWDKQYQLDMKNASPNIRSNRTKECFMIWNSKLAFLKEVIDTNPFQSDKFVWNDIGNVRSIEMKPFIEYFPLTHCISDDKIDFVYIGNQLSNMPIHTTTYFQNKCQLSGSIFGSSSQTILKMHDLYYEMFDMYLQHDNFIGCDQQIWSSLYCKYSYMFRIIDSNIYKSPHTVNKWFLLHHVYSRPMMKMKICLVGPGNTKIPPVGWGACESIVWDYYENLKKLNILVEFISNANLSEVIHFIKKNNFNIVHIMYDDYIEIASHLPNTKIIYTSHYAYITHPNFETHSAKYFKNIFMNVIRQKDHIDSIFAISDEIRTKYIRYGFPPEKIIVMHNGAREDKFQYYYKGNKSDKSIYLAKIEYRKGQHIYQNISSIDFVGQYHSHSFNCNSPQYLGPWDKPTLYKELSHYGNLVLLSNGEADPLVVKEALLSGLGIVVNECCTANLDLTKNFITVIPKDKENDILYVEKKIIENRLISIQQREQIRSYALKTFAWNVVIRKYLSMIQNV